MKNGWNFEIGAYIQILTRKISHTQLFTTNYNGILIKFELLKNQKMALLSEVRKTTGFSLILYILRK